MRNLQTGLCVLALATTVLAEQPLPNTMQYVPDEAGIVLVVPNLNDLTNGIHGFGHALGCDELCSVDTAQLLGEVFDGHCDGLKPEGQFVFALMPGQFQPLLIVPLVTEDAWPGPPVDGAPPFTVSVRGQQWHVITQGNVAVLASAPEAIDRALASEGNLARRVLEDLRRLGGETDHVLLWVDVEAWRPVINPLLHVAEGFMQLGMSMSAPNAEVGMWQWMFEQTRCAVDQADTYVATCRVDDQALHCRDRLSFEADGAIAGYLSQIREPHGAVLRGLPPRPGAIVFGGELCIPPHLPTASELMLQAMLDTPTGRTLSDDAQFKSGMEAAQEIYRLVTGSNGVVSWAPGGGLAMSGIYLTVDPDAVMKHMRQSMPVLTNNKMMSMMGTALEVDLEQRTETIGSTQVDAYTFAFSSNQKDVQRAVKAMYGDRTTFYAAAHPNGVAYAMAPAHMSRALLGQLLTPEPLCIGHEKIRRARAALPSDPHVLVFADLAKLVDLAMAGARATEPQLVPEVSFPEDSGPYAALGIYVEPTALRSEAHIPAASLRIVLDAFRASEADSQALGMR